MNEVSLLESLGQVSASETGQVFRDFLRGHVREMICEVMAAEVTQLCGPKHAPSEGDHFRAGSAQGRDRRRFARGQTCFSVFSRGGASRSKRGRRFARGQTCNSLVPVCLFHGGFGRNSGRSIRLICSQETEPMPC